MSGNIMIVVLILMITSDLERLPDRPDLRRHRHAADDRDPGQHGDHRARRGPLQRRHGGGAADRHPAARRLFRASASSSSRASPPARSRGRRMPRVEFEEHRQAVRPRDRARGPRTSPSTTASSWCCSAPPAAARPRCSTCSPACRRSPPARITIGGRDVTDLDPKDRGLAMVFQSYALYPTKTVRGNLKFGLSAQKLDRAEIERRVAWAAKLLQIEPLLDRKPGAALRRPAAARRDRPRAGQERRRVPVRRAAVEPRRQAAHRDAARDQEAARRAQEDHRLRHPRPDRGDDHGDADRGDGRAASSSRSARPTRSTSVRPTCSSRASSARRR